MMRAVDRGLARKDRRVPARIGIDETSVGTGHEDESLVCDLDGSTVDYVVDDRKKESLESSDRQIEAIAMDRWDPYVRATHDHVPDAAGTIVFDRFHATT
jgi:transposase